MTFIENKFRRIKYIKRKCSLAKGKRITLKKSLTDTLVPSNGNE